MERITNAHCDGMARRLAVNFTQHANRTIGVTWGRPYGHVYHVEQAGTQLALADTAITKRGCYDAMYSACVALEALTYLKGAP